MGVLLLPFRRFIELPSPRFKVCNQCGAICQSIIEKCPALVRSYQNPSKCSKLITVVSFISFWKTKIRERFLIEPCESSDFRFLTIEEFKRMANSGKHRVFFQRWPDWPAPEFWRQISSKERLEKMPSPK